MSEQPSKFPIPHDSPEVKKDPRDIEVEVEVIPPEGRKSRGSAPHVDGDSTSHHAHKAHGSHAHAGHAVPPTRRQDDPFIAFVARLMDTAFVVPGTNIRFGLDPILGLVPGLGDTLTAAVSVVLILQSARYGVPKVVLARMAMNVLANTAVGSIPVVGDAFSVYFKSNVKNLELLRRHTSGAGVSRKASTGDWIFVAGVVAVIVTLLVLVVAGAATLLSIMGDWLRAK